VISNVQAGKTLTITTGGDSNGDTNTSTDRPPSVGRNTLTGPNLLTADIRFSRDIALYKDRAALKLIFEAFNVTNRANYNAITTSQYNFSAGKFTPNPAFLAPTSTFDPRILQLAAKITF
jgi:hypothetical protein